MADDSDVTMWSTAISPNPHSGRKIIFRYAQELSAAFDRATQPVRIFIVWRYQSDKGQPESEEYQRMNCLEDSLNPVLSDDHFATLALVSTGEDLREWTYYAKSEDEFMARLNYALAGTPAFPSEIHTAFDPEWSTYEEFKKGVRNSPVN
jgi:hypothetical protein